MAFSFKLIGIAAGLVFASGALAQQPQTPNPLDVVPDKQLFDTPYGLPITTEKALSMVVAASAESKKRGWKMNIAVMDSGGNLVAFVRETGAQVASIKVAQAKARAAVEFRRETKVFEAAVQGGNNMISTIPGVIASRGGIPIVDNGAIVGAIGVSGGTGSQDEVVAKAGAAAYH
jgi:uncharacterized protein GlcG (DUF336 family)